ncbi:MAG: exonuclease subunit SbcD, partial [Deferribacteraceae bacterium]|nr:exonuclease subunit SbcD [Deferribacteraceae bacterium]
MVAGDIFETHTPTHLAQKMYYDFLNRLPTPYAVIISGNHDSVSLLSAPKELLKNLNVFVVGDVSEKPEGELIPIKKGERIAGLICAAAYNSVPQDALKNFSDVLCIAEEKRTELFSIYGEKVPIIAVGHQSATGLENNWHSKYEGLREESINLDGIAQRVDYFALGHIHTAMTIGGKEHFRYSGSSINMNPMKGGTGGKKVVVVEFKGGKSLIKEVFVPVFQQIIKLEGSFGKVFDEVDGLIRAGV